MGFVGLLDGFSGADDGFPAKVDFIGDRGGTRGLWDLGESTVVVVVFRRDPGRVAVFESAVAVVVVVVVFVRFFGFGISARASAFSLSSAPKYSLIFVSLVRPCRAMYKQALPCSLETLPRRTWRNDILAIAHDCQRRCRLGLCVVRVFF